MRRVKSVVYSVLLLNIGCFKWEKMNEINFLALYEDCTAVAKEVCLRGTFWVHVISEKAISSQLRNLRGDTTKINIYECL